MAISALQSIRVGNTNRNGVCVPSFPHRGLADIPAKNKRNGFRFSLKCKGMAMAQGGANKGNSVVLDASTRADIVQAPWSAVDIVREFYAQINRHQVESVGDLIAEDCVYEDLVFPEPFVGRKDIIDFFKRFTDAVSTDLQFVIDDITSHDASAVGVTWHLECRIACNLSRNVVKPPVVVHNALTLLPSEWRGKTFPFSKGCSFYRCALFNGKRQIIYGRDSVEPATKPGDMALVAIKAVTSLLERFPQLADRF